MNKDKLISIIQKELKNNPKTSSIEIAKNHKLPLHIVDAFKKMIFN